MQLALYYLGVASLFTHELDAMTHSEWRLLLFLRSLPDAEASELFVILHVPLFFAILWLSQHRASRVRDVTRIVVAAFLPVHAVLHFRLSDVPEYEFAGALSNGLIGLAAVCGLGYLAFDLVARWQARRASGG